MFVSFLAYGICMCVRQRVLGVMYRYVLYVCYLQMWVCEKWPHTHTQTDDHIHIDRATAILIIIVGHENCFQWLLVHVHVHVHVILF